MFNFNDVLVFIRVVEAGSFAAAARLLGMPNPTVSRRVAALEREVGTRLLQRTTRSLHMTDAGRLYYEQSSRALQMIEEANLKLAESRSEPSGTLRVTASHGFAAQLLTGATLEFLSRHPKTRIELLLTDERINLIENYVDLAFRAGPLPDSTLIARKLAPFTGSFVPARAIWIPEARPRRRRTLRSMTVSLQESPPRAQSGYWLGPRVQKPSKSPDALPPTRFRR